MAKFNWHRLLEKAWLYMKIFFAVLTLCVISYAYGTYNPNKSAIAEVNAELDLFYMQKIEEMGLQEPEFTYNNDIQFVRAMHKCINYINFSLPKDKRVPYEMIIGQAALESGWGVRAFASKCDSVKEYVRLLNEHNAYKDFRELRAMMLSNNQQLDSFQLIKTLDKFSTTKDYDQRVIRMIKKIRKLEEKK